MSAAYTGSSFPHTWYPERQLIGILNAQTLLQLESVLSAEIGANDTLESSSGIHRPL
jgi:hypothetical protein